jgi:GH18 family chitinase
MTPAQIPVEQLTILNFAFAYIDTEVSCLPNAVWLNFSKHVPFSSAQHCADGQ